MTDIAKDFDVATDDDLAADQSAGIGEFLASHGGPFFELQRRVGVLEEDALHAGRRAAIFVALAWGVPLLLSLLQGHAFGPQDSHPYLLDFGAWARFFIATGLFLMAEQQVEYGLRGKLGEFVRAPLLAPEFFQTRGGSRGEGAKTEKFRRRGSRLSWTCDCGSARAGSTIACR